MEPITVYYEKENVGHFLADIVVDGTVVLELKSVRKIIEVHEVQLVNYLVATGKEVGVLINFEARKVEIIRKVKNLGLTSG